MTNTQTKQKIIQLTLSTYLSEWNTDLPFCRILEAIADGDYENAVPWQPFEDMDSQELANSVSDTASYGFKLFGLKDDLK